MYATFHQVCSDVGVIWVVQQYYTLKVFETFYRPDKSFFLLYRVNLKPCIQLKEWWLLY